MSLDNRRRRDREAPEKTAAGAAVISEGHLPTRAVLGRSLFLLPGAVLNTMQRPRVFTRSA
jgi:hypothetical protein